MPINEDALDDLSDIVGPELAGLVHCSPSPPSLIQPVKTVFSTSQSSSVNNPTSTMALTPPSSSSPDMPPDISDLKSSDLLQTLSAVIDIDKMFADFQADQQQQINDHQQVRQTHIKKGGLRLAMLLLNKKTLEKFFKRKVW